jgi:hypothetical protein
LHKYANRGTNPTEISFKLNNAYDGLVSNFVSWLYFLIVKYTFIRKTNETFLNPPALQTVLLTRILLYGCAIDMSACMNLKAKMIFKHSTNFSIFTANFWHNWSRSTTLQMFRIITTKDRKAHSRWTVNIWYRLYVGCNPFICRQRVGQAGILLSAKTTLHWHRNLPRILMCLVTVVFCVRWLQIVSWLRLRLLLSMSRQCCWLYLGKRYEYRRRYFSHSLNYLQAKGDKE